MADTTTANYGWVKPDPGGDSNTWGNILNSTIDAIDASLAKYLLVDASGNAYLKLNKTASGDASYIEGDMATKARWQIVLGDSTAETGTSSGSNFVINAYGDAGAYLRTPLSINRSTGICTLSAQPVGDNDIATKIYVDSKVAAIDLSPYYLKTGGAISGNVNVTGTFGAAGNSNLGNVSVTGTFGVGGASTFSVSTFNGAADFWANTSFHSTTAFGNTATFNSTPNFGAGIGFPNFYSGHAYQFGWNGSGLLTTVDGASIGYLVKSATGGGYTGVVAMSVYGASSQMNANLDGGGSCTWNVVLSDRRLKSDVTPAGEDALAALRQIPIYQCVLTPPFPNAKPQHWNWAMMADEVETLVPSAFVPPVDENGYATLRELPLIAALVRAVQQLAARVEELERGK